VTAATRTGSRCISWSHPRTFPLDHRAEPASWPPEVDLDWLRLNDLRRRCATFLLAACSGGNVLAEPVEDALAADGISGWFAVPVRAFLFGEADQRLVC
jgi:hypothetical protein